VIRVRAVRWERTGPFAPGASIHEAVRDLGHVIDFACGGNALCGTCCVLVTEGAAHLTPAGGEEIARLAELDREPPFRLSCQARLARDGAVAIRIEELPA